MAFTSNLASRFSAKIVSGACLGLATFALAACSDATSDAPALDTEEPAAFDVVVSSDLTVAFTDGAMAAFNDCVERNNSDLLDPVAIRTACAWAHSVPFAGNPPGIRGQMTYSWPSPVITVENRSPLLLLTEVCVHLQFDATRTITNSCGRIVGAPLSIASTTIAIRNELDQLGIGPDYEIDPETFRWEISSVRYIQLLKPAPQDLVEATEAAE